MIAPYRGWTIDTKREVKGYHCVVEGEHYIILGDAEIKPIDPDMGGFGDGIYGFVEVIPASVGQFTGLHDKNKKDIYGSIPIDGKMSKGGDILKWDRSKILSVVEWCVAGFTMKVNTPKGIRNYSMLNNYECIEPDMILDEHEVIGNATEHPDLLKGERE